MQVEAFFRECKERDDQAEQETVCAPRPSPCWAASLCSSWAPRAQLMQWGMQWGGWEEGYGGGGRPFQTRSHPHRRVQPRLHDVNSACIFAQDFCAGAARSRACPACL